MNEAPPSFSPPVGGAPVRKKTSVLVIVLVVVALSCVAICAVAGFFGYSALKRIMPMAGCLISFDEVRQSMVLYSKDHDGKLPPAEKWQDEVRSYFKKVQNEKGNRDNPFKNMDPDGQWGCSQGDGKPMTGMAFNSELSGKKVADIKDPYGTTLIFEIAAPATNAHQPYVARDPDSGPEFMGGAHRPWWRMPIKGQAPELNSGRSSRWRPNQSSDDWGSSDDQKPPNSTDTTSDTPRTEKGKAPSSKTTKTPANPNTDESDKSEN